MSEFPWNTIRCRLVKRVDRSNTSRMHGFERGWKTRFFPHSISFKECEFPWNTICCRLVKRVDRSNTSRMHGFERGWKTRFFPHSTWKANTKSIWSKAVGFTLYTNAPMTRQSQPCSHKVNLKQERDGRREEYQTGTHTQAPNTYRTPPDRYIWRFRSLLFPLLNVWRMSNSNLVDLTLSRFFSCWFFFINSLSLLSLEYSNNLLRTSVGIIQHRFKKSAL